MKKLKKGFAVISLERRKEIAAMGGRRAHELKKAHRWTSEEAKRAGSIGGRAKRKNREEVNVS